MANSVDVRLRFRCAYLLFAAMGAATLALASQFGLAASGDDSTATAPLARLDNGISTAAAVKLAAAGDQSPPAAADSGANQSAVSKYFSEWFERSDRAKETQPHWMTPVVTVTPRLEQEYRYDQLWQIRPKGVSRENFGLNKGLELIPTEHTEVIISVPGYIKETGPKGVTEEGWADESFLLKLQICCPS